MAIGAQTLGAACIGVEAPRAIVNTEAAAKNPVAFWRPGESDARKKDVVDVVFEVRSAILAAEPHRSRSVRRRVDDSWIEIADAVVDFMPTLAGSGSADRDSGSGSASL